MATLSPQDRLGPYRILELLAHGGMGSVFAAVHEELRRPVAIKLLKQHDPELLVRFQREMRISCSLTHPHVVRTLDVGELQGEPYIVMERLEGKTLKAVLEVQGRLPWRAACQILSQLADGLASLHARGILHRDIKPTNLYLCDDGTPKLIDFGLARHVDGTLFTQDGQIPGSPGYIAPELFIGTPFGPASDIWSLGCVLYQMLVGQHPRSETGEGWVRQLVNWKPRSIRELDPALPVSLDRLVSTMLHANPAQRPDAGAIKRNLEQLVKTVEGVSAKATGRAAATQVVTRPSPAPARRWIGWLVGLLVCGSVAFLPRPQPFGTQMRVLFDAGRYNALEAAARKELARQTPDRQATLWLARALRAEGRWKAAEAIFQLLCAGAQPEPDTLLTYGELLVGQRRLTEAKQVLEKIRSSLPGERRRVELELALIMADQRRFPEAQALARGVLQTEPDQLEVLLALGKILQLQGQFEAAETLYREALVRKPRESALHVARMSNLARSHTSREAAEYGEAQLHACGYPVNLLLAVNSAWGNAGELANMQRVLELALARYPEHPSLRLARASLERMRGNYAEAEHESRQVVKDYPLLREGLAELGAVLNQRARPAEVEELYRQAANRAGEEPEPLVLLASHLRQLHRHQEAEPLLVSLRSRTPHDACVLTELAEIRQSRGDLAGAEKLFHLAYLQRPEWLLPISRLAGDLFTYRDGNPEKALAFLRQCAQSHPYCLTSRAYEGVYLMQLGRFMEARQVLETLHSMDPVDVFTTLKYAECLESLGLREKAEAVLQHVRRFDLLNFHVVTYLLDLYIRGGHGVRARELCTEVAARCPAPDYQSLPAQYLRDQGKLGEAAALLAGCLKADPSNTRIRWLLVGVEQARQQFSRAEQLIRDGMPFAETAARHHLILQFGDQHRWAEAEAEFAIFRSQPLINSIRDSSLYLSVMREKQRRFPEAEQLMRDQLRLYPYADHFTRQLASALENGGHSEAARQLCEKLLQRVQGSYLVQIYLAGLLQRMGKLVEAEEQIRRAMVLQPLNHGLPLSLASLLNGLHRTEEAIRVLEKLPIHGTGDITTVRFLSSLYEKVGRPAAAEATLRRGLPLGDPTVIHNYFDRLHRTGQIARAQEASQELLAAGVERRLVEAEQIETLVAQRRLPEAEALCRRSLARDPENVFQTLTLAGILGRQNRLQEANAALEAYLTRHGEAGAVHLMAGQLLLKGGQLAGAEKHARRVVALAPENAEGWLVLANVRDAQKKPQEALGALRKAFQLQSDSRDVVDNLCSHLAQAGQGEEALSVALGFKRGTPGADVEPILLTIVKLLPPDRREAVLRKAVAQEPLVPVLWRCLAARVKEKGQTAEAIGYLRRALKLKPESAATTRELGSLLVISGATVEGMALLTKANQLEASRRGR
jgi:tetratricopeptide (TPR) repeat protein